MKKLFLNLMVFFAAAKAFAGKDANLEHFRDLAKTYLKQGKVDAAERLYFKALALNPDFIDVAFGQKIESWKKEDQFHHNGYFFKEPAWEGESLEGKTLLIYAKKGLGDTIQFSRFIEKLIEKKKPLKVLFIPQTPLHALFKETLTKVEVLPWDIDLETLMFDTHISLLALPDVLDVHVDEIAKKPYLKIDRELAARFQKQFFNKTGLKLGLVWSGDPKHIHNPARSISLDRFSTLFELQNVQFFSFQIGEASGELKSVSHPIMDLSPCIHSMKETAAFLANLDVLVSVDTSSAHLGGALGTPTYLLLCKETDIKWSRGPSGEDNLWYETVETIRQEKQGDWDPVFEKLQMYLLKKIDERNEKKAKA